jgi:predicted DNA-binding transcriptional regulator AlpA
MALNANNGKRSGHTRPVAPTISLHQPGRLRVAHVLALLSVSHSTFYAGLRKGRYPKADGHDGKLPFWSTQTIRDFLARKG